MTLVLSSANTVLWRLLQNRFLVFLFHTSIRGQFQVFLTLCIGYKWTGSEKSENEICFYSYNQFTVFWFCNEHKRFHTTSQNWIFKLYCRRYLENICKLPHTERHQIYRHLWKLSPPGVHLYKISVKISTPRFGSESVSEILNGMISLILFETSTSIWINYKKKEK